MQKSVTLGDLDFFQLVEFKEAQFFKMVSFELSL